MNRFNKIIFAAVFLFALLLFAANIALNYFLSSEEKYYMTEINRACADMEKDGYDADLSDYVHIKDTEFLPSDAGEAEFNSFFENNSAYIIKHIDGARFSGFAKFTVTTGNNADYNGIRLLLNALIIIIGITVIFILVYLKRCVIKPFNEVSEMPAELAKGHLTKNLKENKNRFFGKFIWGLDVLRETLETHKSKELALAKENKMMILSISHDIKTPLSAIKLYAKALPDNENLTESANRINENAEKIEAFVNDIIKTSKEDFLDITIRNGEFYLSDLLERIEDYYRGKLAFLKIDFNIKPYQNCLIYGDIERSLEAFENIIENAIKYGDGNNIEISAEREDGCCLVTVSNSGNTLPENETVHIFDSFWRGSNTSGKQGSGLGLYICRKIFAEMKGDIFAEVNDGKMHITAVLKII